MRRGRPVGPFGERMASDERRRETSLAGAARRVLAPDPRAGRRALALAAADLDPRGFLSISAIGVILLAAGLWQQVNLILLVFTLSAGPLVASIFGGRSMLHRLNVQRRVPAYVFSGDPLVIDYTLENGRRWYAALALFIEDSLAPVDRSVSGAASRDAAGFLRAGCRPGSGADPLAVQQPQTRQVSVSRSGSGHPVPVRAGRASCHDRAVRTRCWFIPRSAI